MPAEITHNKILPSLGQEVITITDDFGTDFLLHVPVSDTAHRQTRIDSAIAQQSANQAAIESYASTNKIDLTKEKTAGMAKKAHMKGTK
jgi:hypothetical protein